MTDDGITRIVSRTLPPACTPTIEIRSAPEGADWQLRFCDNVVYRPMKDCEPNRFHRWMQRLAFGVKWERVSK